MKLRIKRQRDEKWKRIRKLDNYLEVKYTTNRNANKEEQRKQII